MTKLITPIWAGVLAIVLAGIGVRLITDARKSHRTGVSHVLFQWPTDFDRERQPVQYWLTVSLAIIVGCGLLIAAALCAVSAVTTPRHGI